MPLSHTRLEGASTFSPLTTLLAPEAQLGKLTPSHITQQGHGKQDLTCGASPCQPRAEGWGSPRSSTASVGRGLTYAVAGVSLASTAPLEPGRAQPTSWPAYPAASACSCRYYACSSKAPPPSSLRSLSATTTKPTLPCGTGATTVTWTTSFTFATQVSVGEGVGSRDSKPRVCREGRWWVLLPPR